MRAYLLGPSILLLAFAFALPLLVVVGGGEKDALDNAHDRAQGVSAKNPIRRAVNRTFYWLSDRRPLCGTLGLLGLALSIFWK